MKKILLLVVTLVLVASCDKDKDTPPNNNSVSIETLFHSFNANGGVTLTGKISNVEVPIDYGFVINMEENGTYGIPYGNTIKFITGVTNGEFSIEFSSGLTAGITYYYNTVAFKNGRYIYGEEKSFVSNGSASPVINSITPIQGHLGDTLVIKGHHFSYSPTVYFNTQQSNILVKSDTLISCIVTNNTNYNSDVVPNLELKIKSVSHNEVIDNNFSLYTPRVDSISPFEAFPGDTLTIYGDHFDLKRNNNQLHIPSNYGTAAYPDVIRASRTELEFVLREIQTYYPTIEIEAQNQTIEVKNKYKHVLPEITGISNTIFNYGDRMVVYGSNFPDANGHTNDTLNYQLGVKNLPSFEVYRDSLVIDIIESNRYEDFIIDGLTINFFNNEIHFDQTIEIDENYLRVAIESSSNDLAYGVVNDELYSVSYPHFISDKYLAKFNQTTNNFNYLYPNDPFSNAPLGYDFVFYQSKFYAFDNSVNFPTINFYSYNILTNENIQLQPFPGEQRSMPFSYVVGDYMYYGLGRNTTSSDGLSDIWRYSFINDTWEFVLDFPGINSYATAKVRPLIFAIGSNLYIGGGQPDYNPQLQDFWELNTNTNSVTVKSNLPITTPIKMTGFNLNGKGFVDYGNETHIYNPNTDTWSTQQTGLNFIYNKHMFQNGNYVFSRAGNSIIKIKNTYFEN